MGQKRATNDAEKQFRRQSIIDIVDKLFEKEEFKQITMAKIAEKAGLAKGTLFTYFQSKEDIFISLTEQKMDEWVSDLEKKVESPPCNFGSMDPETFTELMLSSVDGKIIVKLLSILDDTLEQNLDFKRILQFKTFSKQRLIRVGEIIEAALGKLQKGSGVMIISQLFVCLTGAYKTCNFSETAKLVSKEPGMEMFNRTFNETMRNLVKCYLVGFLSLAAE